MGDDVASSLRNLDEAELVERAGNGDEAAFERLYDSVAARARASLTTLLSDAAEAEDVFHEAMMVLLDGQATYDPRRGSFTSWLLGIARNKAIDRLRARGTDAAAPASLVAGVDDELAAAVDSLVAEDGARGAAFALPRFVMTLPIAQRRILFLRYAASLSAPEIAVLEGRSADAVRQLQRCALETLRARRDVQAANPTRNGDLASEDREGAASPEPRASRRHSLVRLPRPSPVLTARRAFAF